MAIPRGSALAFVGLCGLAFPARAQQGRTVGEREPNNVAAVATNANFGDTLVGNLASLQDVDFFSVDIPAGTLLKLRTRDSDYFIVFFYDSDGRTILTGLGGDSPNEPDYPKRFPITRSGRYFVAVHPRNNHEWTTPPGAGYWVTIDGDPLTLGPGDPATPYVSDSSAPYGADALAAGSAADLYVLHGRAYLTHMNAAREFTALDDRLSASQIAVDGFGNVLARGWVPGGQSLLLRVTPSAERSVFTAEPMEGSFNGLTIGPDGDVWTGVVLRPFSLGGGAPWLWRLDPFGILKDSINVAAVWTVMQLAFSPSGNLHMTTETGVYKLVNHELQLVIPPRLGGYYRDLVFDRDGYLYLTIPAGDSSRIALFDPEYRQVNDPFAFVYSLGMAFGTSANGAMTSRLFVTQAASPGRIVELNPAGIRAPGFRIGVDFLPVRRTGHSVATLGGAFADTLHMESAPGAVAWSIVTGQAPPGVTLNPTTGVLEGIPTDTGTFTFTVRATSGSRLGYIRPTISVSGTAFTADDVVGALLGGTPLTPAVAEFLDRHGNHNGRLDVGDLRAYLRTQNRLP